MSDETNINRVIEAYKEMSETINRIMNERELSRLEAVLVWRMIEDEYFNTRIEMYNEMKEDVKQADVDKSPTAPAKEETPKTNEKPIDIPDNTDTGMFQ